MPVDVYFKDPRVAELYKEVGIDDEFTTPWEPGLRDGPTSARFALVDYDSTSNTLTPPAVWDEKNNCYRAPDGTVLDGKAVALPQYHQLSVWATVQNTLDFFESSAGLGRRISWAFEGNRLIVVPHAGYGENAYYDRASKSLQFYWFNGDSGTHLHLPLHRYRQPRIRSRGARWPAAALPTRRSARRPPPSTNSWATSPPSSWRSATMHSAGIS